MTSVILAKLAKPIILTPGYPKSFIFFFKVCISKYLLPDFSFSYKIIKVNSF